MLLVQPLQIFQLPSRSLFDLFDGFQSLLRPHSGQTNHPHELAHAAWSAKSTLARLRQLLQVRFADPSNPEKHASVLRTQ
jgi:hypothetical protein